ncbi:MAG: hypothetical protein N0A03_07345 [Anaerolineae bacterium]|nr:hypothetical protein [Anaerolineae bacterium]
MDSAPATGAVGKGARWVRLPFPLTLWVGLRVLSSIMAAFASALRPITDLEGRVPIWPPTGSLALWLERVLVAPWARWDALWYERIVVSGYRPDDGTAQFHPLYPWLAVPLARLGIPPMLALLTVSTLAALGLLVAFHRLAEREVGPLRAQTSTVLFATFPVAFILFAPYPEGLFLLWAVLALMGAREGRWWAAGAAGGLAALTRQQGLFLVLPLAWELWTARKGKEGLPDRPAGYHWLSLLLVPLGYGLWMAYRLFVLRDAVPDFSSVHGLIYSLLVSPSASQVVPVQTFLWPWEAMRRAIVHVVQTGDGDTVYDLVLAGLFLVPLALAWRRLRGSDRLYVAAMVLAAFSYHTGSLHPYMGLPRHLLLAVPVFLPLGAIVRRRWQRRLVADLSIAGWLFLVALYVLHSWVP